MVDRICLWPSGFQHEIPCLYLYAPRSTRRNLYGAEDSAPLLCNNSNVLKSQYLGFAGNGCDDFAVSPSMPRRASLGIVWVMGAQSLECGLDGRCPVGERYGFKQKHAGT